MLKDFYDILKSILTYFKSKTSRLVVFFGIVLLIIAIDNIFSFSFYRNINNKISTIKEINICINDTSLSNLERQELITLRQKVFKRTTIIDNIYLSSSSFFTSLNIKATQQNITAKSILLMLFDFLIKSLFWILLFIFSFYLLFADKSTKLFIRLYQFSVFDLFFAFASFAQFKALTKIFINIDSSIIKYTSFILLNFLLIALFYIGTKNRDKLPTT